MSERRLGFAPKPRKGEFIPAPPDDHEVTRFHGELVLVPRRLEGEPYVGNSPYTRRQVQMLDVYDRIRNITFEEDAYSQSAW